MLRYVRFIAGWSLLVQNNLKQNFNIKKDTGDKTSEQKSVEKGIDRAEKNPLFDFSGYLSFAFRRSPFAGVVRTCYPLSMAFDGRLTRQYFLYLNYYYAFSFFFSLRILCRTQKSRAAKVEIRQLKLTLKGAPVGSVYALCGDRRSFLAPEIALYFS